MILILAAFAVLLVANIALVPSDGGLILDVGNLPGVAPEPSPEPSPAP